MEKFFEELYEVLENAILSCKSKTIALSGGLDSSIIAYFLRQSNCRGIAVTAQDFLGTDLTYCQLASKELNIPLEIINASTAKILEAVEETIKILKIFNDIEIRNSVVMYLVLSALKEKGESSIISGDGADELFAGYSFFLKKNEKDLQQDLERIWKIMHFPSKKIGDALGITVETPFLQEDVVELAKKIPVSLKVNTEGGQKYGKWILRKTFEEKLPKNIIWREKSAMQDGAGTAGLYQFFESITSDEAFSSKTKKIKEDDNVSIRTKESLYYYEVYRKYFDPPYKLHSSDSTCPYCQNEVEIEAKFCRMCGTFPI